MHLEHSDREVGQSSPINEDVGNVDPKQMLIEVTDFWPMTLWKIVYVPRAQGCCVDGVYLGEGYQKNWKASRVKAIVVVKTGLKFV